MSPDQIERAVLLIFEIGGLVAIYLRIKLAEKNICDRKDCPLKRDPEKVNRVNSNRQKRRRRRSRPTPPI